MSLHILGNCSRAQQGQGRRGGRGKGYALDLGDDNEDNGVPYPIDEMAEIRRRIAILTETVQRLLPPSTNGSDGSDDTEGGTHHSIDNIFWAP